MHETYVPTGMYIEQQQCTTLRRRAHKEGILEGILLNARDKTFAVLLHARLPFMEPVSRPQKGKHRRMEDVPQTRMTYPWMDGLNSMAQVRAAPEVRAPAN
jgi:hypothetical protein